MLFRHPGIKTFVTRASSSEIQGEEQTIVRSHTFRGCQRSRSTNRPRPMFGWLPVGACGAEEQGRPGGSLVKPLLRILLTWYACPWPPLAVIIAPAPTHARATVVASHPSSVKALFTELGAKYEVYEVTEYEQATEIKMALEDLTGQWTVPNVWIGGKHVGGCDDTMRLHSKGELLGMLAEAGAL